MKRLSIKRALEFVRATEEFLNKEYSSGDIFGKNIPNNVIKAINSSKMKYDLRKIIEEMDLVIVKSKEENEDPCEEFINNKRDAVFIVDMLLNKRGDIDFNIFKERGVFSVINLFSDFRAYNNYLHHKTLFEFGKHHGYSYDNGFIVDYELSLVAFEQENMLQSYIQKKGKRGKARPKYL